MIGEIRCTRDHYKILNARILCKSFPAFHFLKDVCPYHTDCQYSREMISQSVVVPLPVLIKDEKKYSDMVDVLAQFKAAFVLPSMTWSTHYGFFQTGPDNVTCFTSANR